MDNKYLLKSLNKRQYEAVTAPLASQLIIAGAGSGKTTVLVHRIAWLIENYNIQPSAILAVTFTNKAANEMKQRIAKLLDKNANEIWIGTFHSIAHKILRRYSAAANLNSNFQIIDTSDQLRIIKNIIKEMNLDDKQFVPKKILHFICSKKDSGLRANHINPGYRTDIKIIVEVYRRYSYYCQKNSVVDFSELLLRLHELFLNNKNVLQKYQQTFKYILVDEFQDTNSLQYAWLRLIASANNIMAVGDDDQSIYGWRGACIGNMKKFAEDFANIEPIKLEHNYRSSSKILQAANTVIANNTNRFDKKLICELEAGEAIQLYQAVDNTDEANFIAKYANKIVLNGDSWQDIAVLYRSNAQSRILEEVMVQRAVPYKIYGGSRFFERSEIKHVLAYLRIICNKTDNIALERIINFPPRGIGDKTLERLQQNTEATESYIWHSIEAVVANNDDTLSAGIKNKLAAFIDMINDFKQYMQHHSFHELVQYIIITTKMVEYYKQDFASGKTRIENLEELINACSQLNASNNQAERNTEQQAVSFLDQIALDSSNRSDDQKQQNCLQMMTMHAAKGLEFKHVFIIGLEEDLFPSKLSVEENNIEEERRLYYVAITRAMKNLYLSYCDIRNLYGYDTNKKPSRFINEIPDELINKINIINKSYSSKKKLSFKTYKKYSNTKFKSGHRVKHDKFGVGKVISSVGSGDQEKVKIVFANNQVKSLSVAQANLTFA